MHARRFVMGFGAVLGLLASGCGGAPAAGAPPSKVPTMPSDAPSRPPSPTSTAPTDAQLRDLVARAPARLQAVHTVEADGSGVPVPWSTHLHGGMELQVAASGRVEVLLDGVVVLDARAADAGALVPEAPLYVHAGALVVRTQRAPAVVGFVRALVDENPHARPPRKAPAGP